MYELAKHVILYPVEADAVKDTVQYQFRTVYENVIDVGNDTFRHLHLRFAGFALLTIKVEFRVFLQLAMSYPLQSLLTKRRNL